MISSSNRLRIVLAAAVVLLFMFVSYAAPNLSYAFVVHSRSNISSVTSLNKAEQLTFKDNVLFSFQIHSDFCDYIDIYIDDNAHFNEREHDYAFELLDNSKQVIPSSVKTVNSVIRITPSGNKVSNGNYYLRVSNTTDNPVRFPLRLSKNYDTGNTFTRDGVKENYSLSGHSVVVTANAVKICIVSLFCILLVVFIMSTGKIGLRSYIVFAVCFGFLFIMLQGFPASSNEAGSVVEAERLSHGYFSLSGAGQYWLPSNLLSDMTYMSDTRTVLSNDFALFDADPGNGFSLVNILLSGISMFVGLFHLPYFWHIAVVRLICFILASVISGAAIGISGRYKKLFFFLATIPGPFLAFATISSYSIVFALALFYLSCCCNALVYYSDNKEQLSVPKLILMMVSLAFIGSQNLILMFVLLSIVFVIPDYAFSACKKTLFMWLFTAIMLLVVGLRVYIVIVNTAQIEPIFNEMTNRFSDLVKSPSLLLTSLLPFITDTLSGTFKHIVSGSSSELLSSCLIGMGTILFMIGSSTLNYWIARKESTEEQIDSEQALNELRSYKNARIISIITAVFAVIYLVMCYLSPMLFKDGIWAVFAVIIAMVCIRRKAEDQIFDIPILCVASLNTVLVFCGLFLR